jgi:hypothetical protein
MIINQSINQSITTNPPPCRRPTTPAGILSPAAAHWRSRSRDNRGCWRRYILFLRSRSASRLVVVVAVVVMIGCTTTPMSDSRAIRSQRLAPHPEMMSGGLTLATPWTLRRWHGWGSDFALAVFAAILPGVWRPPPCLILPGVAFRACQYGFLLSNCRRIFMGLPLATSGIHCTRKAGPPSRAPAALPAPFSSVALPSVGDLPGSASAGASFAPWPGTST